VSGKLLDFDYDPHPAAVAKTTSATPPQDAIPIVTPGY
jgi:hypothetical protein